MKEELRLKSYWKYAVSAIIAMCDLQFYQVNKFDLQHDQGANILGSNETDFFKFI